MKGQDIVSFGVTFFVGIIVGVYLYVYGFMPQYGVITDWTEGVGELAIVVREYGDCTTTMTCVSYRVAEDGSYRKLTQAGNAEAEPTVQDGEISKTLRTQLHTTFKASSLKTMAEPITPQNCASAQGVGSDYQLDITISGVAYSLDTCATAFARNTAAQKLFEALQSEV